MHTYLGDWALDIHTVKCIGSTESEWATNYLINGSVQEEMDLLSLFSGLFATGCLVWIFKQMKNKQKKQLPPGPRGIPAFQSFVKAAKSFTLHYYADEWRRSYGDIVSISFFNQNIVFLNTQDLMRKCFCDEKYKMLTNDRPETFASMFIFNNENVGFSPIGAHHSRLRKLVHGSLKIYGDGVKVFEDTIMSELKSVVTKINSKKDTDIDIDDILSKSLLNVIHILLTDRPANSNEAILEKMKDYNSVITNLFGPEIDLPLTMMPFLRHLPGMFRSICDRATARVEQLGKALFEPMKANFTPGEPRGVIQCGLEAILSLNDDSKMNEEHVRHLMLEIISAGYLTTRGVLLGIVLLLIEQPDLQEHVYKQVKETVGDRAVTPGDRKSLSYIDAMIIEAMRYLVHGPFALPHKTKQDIEIEGYSIPKNSTIMVNLWGLGHDETIWDDPWVFRPERFLDDEGKLLPPDHPIRQKFTPFGVGKRQCPGEVFAKTRLFLFITTLVQHFKFLPPEGGLKTFSDSRTWIPGIILQPENFKCRVELRDRDSAIL